MICILLIAHATSWIFLLIYVHVCAWLLLATIKSSINSLHLASLIIILMASFCIHPLFDSLFLINETICEMKYEYFEIFYYLLIWDLYEYEIQIFVSTNKMTEIRNIQFRKKLYLILIVIFQIKLNLGRGIYMEIKAGKDFFMKI